MNNDVQIIPLPPPNIICTEIYEGRNATGTISLFKVVIRNKQMEYIEQIKQNRTESYKIEPNRTMKFN